MLHKLKITSYALIILLILVLPSQADEYCTAADMCAAAAEAAGKMLGNEGKNGISGYPFVLETNTYGCWYYPDSHANKNYAGSAFWGAASSEAQMRDPDPGAAHHVRLKCEGGGPAPEAQLAAPHKTGTQLPQWPQRGTEKEVICKSESYLESMCWKAIFMDQRDECYRFMSDEYDKGDDIPWPLASSKTRQDIRSSVWTQCMGLPATRH